ncbi:MutS protein msh4, partial [Cryomyces antarcticus]
LTTKEEMFFATRQGKLLARNLNARLICTTALKAFLDVDKILTALIMIPTTSSVQHTEQSVNNVIMLKQFVNSIKPIFEALTGSRSAMLEEIRQVGHIAEGFPQQKN